MVGTVIQAL